MTNDKPISSDYFSADRRTSMFAVIACYHLVSIESVALDHKTHVSIWRALVPSFLDFVIR